jgi:uncharacterized protein (DUF362 family)
MKPVQKQGAITRRGFLKLLGLSGLSMLLTHCSLLRPEPPAPTAAPTASPTLTPTPVPLPTATTAPVYKAQVATARVANYDLDLIRRELAQMLDNLGGLENLVRPGARVGIKPNLTAGTWIDGIIPAPATEMYTTHPAVVQALAELLVEAGAGQIIIMEGMYDALTYQNWGYVEAAKSTGAALVDLCQPDPYPAFTGFPVGSDYFIYDKFNLNGLLREIDVFVSVAKLKCHSSGGVTLVMKNLFGIAPLSLYRLNPSHTNRSAFHGNAAYETRVPRVIVDLNRARPVQLALVDGISTVEGGAGPWDRDVTQVKPGILVAGFDPVATDAVSTAIMGFDPSAGSQTPPFNFCDNHLALAAQMGLGTNRLDEIGIVGPQIDELLYPFKTAQGL